MKKALVTLLIALLFSFSSYAEEASTWSGTDDSGLVILPKALAEYCQIKEEDAERMAGTIACINELQRLKADPSGDVQIKAKKLYQLIVKQMVFAAASEGIGVNTYAVKYEKEVLEPLSDIHSDAASSNKEFITNITQLEEEGAKLQRELLKLKTTELQLRALYESSNFRGRR